MFNNSQKGVSLIITFFIMTIVLAVVLSISTILYSELRIIRNMGNSVVAFFAADSGAEKVLYYDRKIVPAGAASGICNICTACDAGSADCDDCTADGDDCDQCTDCMVAFKTIINQGSSSEKSYDVVAGISPGPTPPPGQCGTSEAYLQSRGIYKNTKRAINLDIETEIRTGIGPSISNPQVIITDSGKITISVTLTPYPECKDYLVTAYIYDESDGSLVATLELQAAGQCEFSKPWNGGELGHTYYVTIGGIDPNGFCASVTVIPQ